MSLSTGRSRTFLARWPGSVWPGAMVALANHMCQDVATCTQMYRRQHMVWVGPAAATVSDGGVVRLAGGFWGDQKLEDAYSAGATPSSAGMNVRYGPTSSR